jgi:tagatose-1,6-bisphosphate aldolase
MEIENPHLKEYRKLMVLYDKDKSPENLKKLVEVKKLNEEFIQSAISTQTTTLASVTAKVTDLQEKIVDAKANKKKNSADKKLKYTLYNASVALYRECRELLHETQNTKTFARNYLYTELGYDIKTGKPPKKTTKGRK